MAYQAPYIDEAGLHISSYNDIRDSLLEEMRAIYGSDIYLDNDSQDYQMISAFALMAYDVQQALLLAYNNISPATATGAGLDRVVALNGIRRAKASYSTCLVKLTGAAGTIINNGIVQDSRGIQWRLPESVTIGDDGIATALVTCTIIGRITAATGDIRTIVTPTRGWTSVTNDVPAIAGVNQETDSALRAKQRISTANPSNTVFEGTIGAIANVDGVIRYAAYENDTDAIKDGLPPHSITLVVDGGIDKDVAQAIYLHKTPGCYTNGDIEVNVSGSLTDIPIRFYRPHYVDVAVKVSIKPLTGYTDATASQIKANIYDYINGLAIGETLYTPNLNAPILSALNGQPSFYVTGLEASKKSEGAGGGPAEVIVIAQIEAAQIAMEDITIEVVP